MVYAVTRFVKVAILSLSSIFSSSFQQVECTIPKDDGTFVSYARSRVQHDNSHGPMKGGIINHPENEIENSNKEEIENWWRLLTWSKMAGDSSRHILAGTSGDNKCTEKSKDEKLEALGNGDENSRIIVQPAIQLTTAN
ncbi:hypothetical protein L6452_40336 [Arctium lappa]|uniref:Uncharacterized protein n=1 Tax=Arctium lappa TaxID=4217 RepID=A0ACB8XL42_ARCLA|nr:hypothetical protein L6452_40336 [Arctium lappa]